MNSRLVGCVLLAVLVIGAAADGADTVADTSSDKPAKKDDKKSSGKSFKPVMISRHTRHAIYPHRHDIQYEDGGYAHVIHFPQQPRKPDNRVEALVGRPRVYGWVPVNRPKQYIEPLYNDEYDISIVVLLCIYRVPCLCDEHRDVHQHYPHSVYRNSHRSLNRHVVIWQQI